VSEHLFLIQDFAELEAVIAPLTQKLNSYQIPFITFVFALATLMMIFKVIKGRGEGEMISLLGRLVLICALLALHKQIFSGMFWVTGQLAFTLMPKSEYLAFLKSTTVKIHESFSLWDVLRGSITGIVMVIVTMVHVIALKLFEIYRVFKLLFLFIIAPITLIVGLLESRKENPINYYITAFETCMWKPVAAIIFKLLMLLNTHFGSMSYASGEITEVSASINFFSVISFSVITIVLTLKIPQITHWIVTKSSNAADDVLQTSYKVAKDAAVLGLLSTQSAVAFASRDSHDQREGSMMQNGLSHIKDQFTHLFRKKG